ncbi:MAG: type I-E CRISPR-associated protein Cas5/CasD [Firmicutes bacterium]|nr:type I-E CRISPR-associated protein Cas5/CasD [Bacillota bacterium]
MAVLLLRFDAPMQSWGTEAKLKDHPTDHVPSKSAIIGIIASAEGRCRDADISDLRCMRFGVRIDALGKLLRDYHVYVNGGSFGRAKMLPNGHYIESIPSSDKNIGNRYYLQDAVFICGIELPRERLEEIRYSLLHPANALFCGRRCCPVTAELVGEIVEGTLETALKTDSGEHLAYLDAENDLNESNIRITRDDPMTFSPIKREYTFRKSRKVYL